MPDEQQLKLPLSLANSEADSSLFSEPQCYSVMLQYMVFWVKCNYTSITVFLAFFVTISDLVFFAGHHADIVFRRLSVHERQEVAHQKKDFSIFFSKYYVWRCHQPSLSQETYCKKRFGLTTMSTCDTPTRPYLIRNSSTNLGPKNSDVDSTSCRIVHLERQV